MEKKEEDTNLSETFQKILMMDTCVLTSEEADISYNVIIWQY